MSSNDSCSVLAEFVNALSPPDESDAMRRILWKYSKTVPPLVNQTEFNRVLTGFTREACAITRPIPLMSDGDEALGEAIRLLERYYREGGYEGALAVFRTNPMAGLPHVLSTLARAVLSEQADRRQRAVLLRFGTFEKRKRIVQEILERFGPVLPDHHRGLPAWVLADEFFELVNQVLRCDSKTRSKRALPS